MRTIKQTVVGVFLVFFLFATPITASAQSVDITRLQLLQEIVALLQKQLELLQAQQLHVQELGNDTNYPIDEAAFYDDDSFLEDIDAEIVARYRINDMDINSPARSHKRYIDRMAELLPESYHQYFVELVVFESERDDVDAFVETTIPYVGQWRYGVNSDVFAEPVDSDLNSELIIHEFGHLFSLHEVFSTNRPSACHEFFEASGCVSPDTIYGKFLTSFWDDASLDRAQKIRLDNSPGRTLAKFYRENRNEFVSSYAASSPAEDFAESFSHFVLYENDSFGEQAAEKVQFFNRFSSTRELKAEILADLDSDILL